MSLGKGSGSPLKVSSSHFDVCSATSRSSKRLSAVPGCDMPSGSRSRSAKNRVNSARPTSETASSCDTSRPMRLVIDPLNSLSTTLETQPQWVIAACGRSLASRANSKLLAPSPIVPTNPSLQRGLPVEGDSIDLKVARRNHTKIGRVPAHCEQSPDALQLVIAFQRICVDQEDKWRVLPLVHRPDRIQIASAVTACCHQCRVGQEFRAFVVKQPQG